MADPKKVKVFDGTNWVDLKADDPNLPISSTDNKVTLSDDDGKFQIETGDPKSVRVTVDKEGRLSVGESSNNVMNYFGNDNPADYVGGSCYGVYADGKCQTAATVYSVFSSSPEADARPDGPPLSRLIHYQTYYDTGGGDAVRCEVVEQIGLNFAGNQFTVGAKNYGVKSGINTENGKENYHLYLFGSAPSMFGGEIRTDNPITTKDSADLDASLQFYKKNYLLRSRDGFGYAVTMGAQYDPAFNNCKYVDKTGTFAFRNYVSNVDSVVNICNKNNLSAATIDFSRGEVSTTQDNSTRFASISNPDWYKGLEYRLYGGVSPGTWTVTPQHKFFGIKPNDEDGTQYEVLSMQWNQFVVSTDGEERMRVTADGKVAVGIQTGISNAFEVYRIDPTLFSDQINSLSAMYHDNSATMQMRNDSQTTGAYASYNFWVRNDTNVSQQAAFSFVSTDSGYAGEFAWTIRSSGSKQYEAMRLTSWALITPGTLQTDTITTRADANTDGSISLTGTGVTLHSNQNEWDTSFSLGGNSLDYNIGANASVNKVRLSNPDYIEDVDARPDDYDPATTKYVQHLEQYYYGINWASPTYQNIGPGGTSFEYKMGGLITTAKNQNSIVTFNEDRSQSVAFTGVIDGATKEARLAVDGQTRLTATEDDIQAFAGYEPQTDQSLVTKYWVQTNGASGNLPISSSDSTVTLAGESSTFTVKTNSKDQLTVDSQGRIQFQSTSGGNVLGDANFDTYLQFNLVGGEAYKDKNIMFRAGQSYLVVNNDATVRLINNAKLKGAADDSAELAFPSSGAATISTGGAAIEQWKAGTANPIYVTPRPDANNFKGVRYRTYAGAASGSSVVAALSVNDAVDATILNSFYAEPAFLNGSGTLAELRGYYAEDGGGVCGKYIAYYSDVKDRRNEANPEDRCETWFVYGLSDAPSYFGGDIQTSRIVGSTAPDTDASLELNQHAKIIAGTSYYQLLNNGFHLFQCDGSQSRFTNDGRFLINTQTSDVGYISTIRQSKAGETGVVRFVTDHPDGTANLYIDCNPTTGIVSLKSSSQVCLVQADGGTYTPTQPNSIATRGWVESVVGSGGSVNPDTVPGTGATARWEEQS